MNLPKRIWHWFTDPTITADEMVRAGGDGTAWRGHDDVSPDEMRWAATRAADLMELGTMARGRTTLTREE